MKKPPCLPDCPNRTTEPNCHMTCKEYIKWKAGKDSENASRQKENTEIDYVTKAQDRMRKHRSHVKF